MHQYVTRDIQHTETGDTVRLRLASKSTKYVGANSTNISVCFHMEKKILMLFVLHHISLLMLYTRGQTDSPSLWIMYMIGTNST